VRIQLGTPLQAGTLQLAGNQRLADNPDSRHREQPDNHHTALQTREQIIQVNARILPNLRLIQDNYIQVVYNVGSHAWDVS